MLIDAQPQSVTIVEQPAYLGAVFSILHDPETCETFEIWQEHLAGKYQNFLQSLEKQLRQEGEDLKLHVEEKNNY